MRTAETIIGKYGVDFYNDEPMSFYNSSTIKK